MTFAAMAGILLSTAGCVTLVSKYDDRTDSLASDIQKETSGHFAKLTTTFGTEDCRYSHYGDFYHTLGVDISALSMRAAAVPKNEQTQIQVDALSSAVKDLMALHKKREDDASAAKSSDLQLYCLSPAAMAPDQRGIDQALRAIMTLEIAKKREG